jgi:hypothetical protein
MKWIKESRANSGLLNLGSIIPPMPNLPDGPPMDMDISYATGGWAVPLGKYNPEVNIWGDNNSTEINIPTIGGATLKETFKTDPNGIPNITFNYNIVT